MKPPIADLLVAFRALICACDGVLDVKIDALKAKVALDNFERAMRLPEPPVMPVRHCERCAHEWTPRQATTTICPKCKSPYWNKPRKEQKAAGVSA